VRKQPNVWTLGNKSGLHQAHWELFGRRSRAHNNFSPIAARELPADRNDERVEVLESVTTSEKGCRNSLSKLVSGAVGVASAPYTTLLSHSQGMLTSTPVYHMYAHDPPRDGRDNSIVNRGLMWGRSENKVGRQKFIPLICPSTDHSSGAPPPVMAAVKDLTASPTNLTSKLSKIPPSDSGSPTPEDRNELLAAARGLVATLEGPEVATWRVVYGGEYLSH
jgi:hypothetical protein